MTRIALLTMLLPLPAAADPGTWRMLDDSELLFEASWEGTALPGRFGAFDVVLDTETGELTDAQLTVTIDVADADMDDPDINEAIVGEEWFAVAEFPLATYTSATIVESAPGEYLASGELDLKGVRQSIDVPMTWSISGDRAEMSGELTIDRLQFNVGSGEWASDDSIGTDVRVSFKVLFDRQ